MIGYPLDSQVTFEPDGTPIYDRAISSAPLRKLIKELFSDGVLPNPSTNMQVVVGDSGMTVKVNAGFAIVNGCLKLEEAQRTLEIQAASSSYDRIDTVVVRLNDEANARICDLYVRAGTPASNPVRPELVRSGSVYEIGLADIFIPRNTSTIAQQRITDTRYETARCGVISSISQFDTTTLYNQIQSDLAGFKTEEQQAFMDWFENLVYVLDGDVAGHLQNEINANAENIQTNADDIVDLQNSVAELNSTLISSNGSLGNKIKDLEYKESTDELWMYYDNNGQQKSRKIIPIGNNLVDFNVGFDVFTVVLNGTTYNDVQLTYIKVTQKGNNRYFILGVCLSGTTLGNRMLAYDSWSNKWALLAQM